MYAQLYGLSGQIIPSSLWTVQVTWQLAGPWLSIQSLLRPSRRQSPVSQKERIYPQMMAGFCSKILSPCCDSPIGAAEGSKKHSYLPLLLQTPSDLLDCMNQLVEFFVQDVLLFCAPLKTGTFCSMVTY